MDLFKNPLIWVVGVIVLLGLWVMSSYNGLVTLEENVKNATAKIETQYQRRMDMIPALMENAEGAIGKETGAFREIVEARSAWANASTGNAKIAAANQFDSALSRLIVTVEAYPQLKSADLFKDVSVGVEGSENRIAFARNELNDAATAYNKSVRLFPRSLIVKLFGFDSEKTLFKSDAGAEKRVKIDYSK
jgi:LemA protein